MLSEKAALLPKPSAEDGKYRLVIHGGAGTMSRQRSTPEQRALYHKTLREALRTGHAVLKEGGEAKGDAPAGAAGAANAKADGSNVPPSETKTVQAAA